MTMRTFVPSRLRPAAALAAATLSFACDEPLKDPQLIEENRVLAARVEVEGEPERASPAPGESVTVRWLVADPAERRPLSWAFAACEAADVARGLPICNSPPFVSVESGDPVLAEPAMQFTVPQPGRLTGAERLVIQGVICADGAARLGGSYEQARCQGEGAQTTLVMLYVTLSSDGVANANPSLAGLPVRLDRSPWDESDPTWLELPSCVDAPAELPRVRAGSGEHELQLEPASELREPLTDDPLHRSIETLQLSHFSTAGSLERPYSVIEGESADSLVSVPWQAPGSASSGGDLVRFYIVARDLRGGADWTVRALCVTP
jgi:hypothetical protein